MQTDMALLRASVSDLRSYTRTLEKALRTIDKDNPEHGLKTILNQGIAR
jgi:hypothetical protein